MQNLEIIAAHMKGELFCHYSYRVSIGENAWDTVTVKSDRPMHDDLKRAFAMLQPHVPVIIQELRREDVPGINSDLNGQEFTEAAKDLIKKFRVFGVLIDVDKGAAALRCTKHLTFQVKRDGNPEPDTEDLGVMPFDTVAIKYDGAYPFALEFRLAIDNLISEVQQYHDGKRAPLAQISMDFNGPLKDGEMGDLENKGDEEGGEPKGKGRGRGNRRKNKKDDTPEEINGEISQAKQLEHAEAGNEETEPLSTYFDKEEAAKNGF